MKHKYQKGSTKIEPLWYGQQKNHWRAQTCLTVPTDIGQDT